MMDLIHGILLEGWKLWLIVGIFFFLAEGTNPGTFSLFFGGVGAWATALVCRFLPAVTESGTLQLLVFSGTSLFSLFTLRSAILRFLNIGKTPPADVFTGKSAQALTVLRKKGIDTGLVSFEGTEWRARLCDESPDEIPAGTLVLIDKSDGLTLYVRPLP